MLSRNAGFCSLIVAGLFCVGLAGCGGDSFRTASAGGSVTYNGETVTAGTVMLSPLPPSEGQGVVGKAAAGVIQSDGKFVLGTYAQGDGAVVGKHRVSFMPPPAETPEENPDGSVKPQKPAQYTGLIPQTTEVEITAGSNDLKIELIEGPKSEQSGI